MQEGSGEYDPTDREALLRTKTVLQGWVFRFSEGDTVCDLEIYRVSVN